MFAIGAIILFVGVLALIGGGLQQLRAGRIAKTPFAKTGDIASKGAGVAGDKGAISAEGNVVMRGPAVVAPVTHTQCLYYDLEVMAKWKVGDTTHTKRVVQERVGAAFAIDDGSGAVLVDTGKGGDFDLSQTFRKTQSRGLMSAITGKPLTFGDNGFTVPTGMRVEGVLIPDSADFEVTERCLMPVPFLYANGRVDEQNRIASPSWISLVLSTKKRDELLAGTATFAKRLLIGGAAASGVGAVVAAIGAVISQ